MIGSNVWGSLAPYGDVSPCSNGIFTHINEYFPFKTVIINDSLQNTLGRLEEKKC